MPMGERAELIAFLQTDDEIRRRELAETVAAASVPKLFG